MSTILDGSIGALVTVLNTARPADVVTIERDRWVDVEVGPGASNVITLASFEDEPEPDQRADRTIDQRRARLGIEIYTSPTPSVTAAAAADAAVAWIGSKCGPVDSGSGLLATAGAVRLTLGKRAAVVGKGGAVRTFLELLLEYRNFTNDLTRAR